MLICFKHLYAAWGFYLLFRSCFFLFRLWFLNDFYVNLNNLVSYHVSAYRFAFSFTLILGFKSYASAYHDVSADAAVNARSHGYAVFIRASNYFYLMSWQIYRCAFYCFSDSSSDERSGA